LSLVPTLHALVTAGENVGLAVVSSHIIAKYSWCRYIYNMQLQYFGMVGSSSHRSNHHVFYLVAEYHHVRQGVLSSGEGQTGSP
jgi:hypothetical protein